jgi:DNA-binding transcriptional ArsR family regulator
MDKVRPKDLWSDPTGAVQSLDVLILLKLVANEALNLSIRELARQLGSVSKSAVDISLRRLVSHGLLRIAPDGSRQVNRLAARELLERAIRWIAPAVIGPFELGLETAYAAAPLAQRLIGDSDPLVMPLPEGPVRGRAVKPLHPGAPTAAKNDPKLHELLAIVDALRIGRQRDREVAIQELRARL